MPNAETATSAEPITATPSVPGSPDTVGATLERLTSLYYKKAEVWRYWHLRIEALIYVAGVFAVFVHDLPLEYPAVGLALVLVTALLAAQGEKLRDTAESLKRQHEYWQGLGIAPSKAMLAEVQVHAPGDLPREMAEILRQGLTFSSARALGPNRLLENLSESSWFTKELAAWCSARLREIFIGSVLIALIVLLVVATSVHGGTASSSVAKCVASTLAFLMSVGVMKSWLAFERYSREAGEIDSEAQRVLASGAASALDAQRLLSEYQLLRASAPAIPTWIWSRKRHQLNQIWNDLKRPNHTTA
jgi:hypothetical protein